MGLNRHSGHATRAAAAEYARRLDEHAGRGHPDPCATPWYVTDPSTGLTQYVEADAWVAWSRWRGAAPADAYDEADYEALEVLSASERTGPGEMSDGVDCALADERAAFAWPDETR